MSGVARAFARPGRKALIAYVTAGYPSVEATLAVAPVLERNGCDLIEMGIPFSDPLADGATIQNASFRALSGGMTPAKCIELARALKEQVEVPLAFMSYYNPLLSYGLDCFTADCVSAGVAGLIVPDLPPDEGRELQRFARPRGIDCIYLLAPTSTDERIRLVSECSSGFIYLVSVAGVTGAATGAGDGLESYVARVRAACALPLYVGFGVGTPAQAARVAACADGVIVGSALLRRLGTATDTDQARSLAQDFCGGLRAAMDAEHDLDGKDGRE